MQQLARFALSAWRLPAAAVLVAWLAAAGMAAGDWATLEGQTVRVQLASGTVYDDFRVSRVSTHSQTGAPQRLLGTTQAGRRRNFRFDSIQQITRGDDELYAADPTSDKAASEDSPDPTPRDADEEHDQWLARLRARGIKPWPPLSQQQHATAIEKHKQRYADVKKLLPSLQLYETEHFLFCSNIPPQQVAVFIASLDRMYAWMQHTYGVDPDTPVWRGKASVFAFATDEQFVAFERQFMKNDPQPGTAGLCHHARNREVCIAVSQGNSADYFGVVLVHETSHGFIYCYRTPVSVPSWVNEGMAEVIASKMVPSSRGVQRKEERFLEALRSTPQPHLGDDFFAVDQNIPFGKYGGATNMTRFLIQTDQQKYVRFIKLLKEGMPWEEALQASYNATKPQLVAAYGRAIGIPQLQP